VELLLESKADIEALNHVRQPITETLILSHHSFCVHPPPRSLLQAGRTALMMAAIRYDSDLVALLLRKGAALEAKDNVRSSPPPFTIFPPAQFILVCLPLPLFILTHAFSYPSSYMTYPMTPKLLTNTSYVPFHRMERQLSLLHSRAPVVIFLLFPLVLTSSWRRTATRP
jgi:hypothetical protein